MIGYINNKLIKDLKCIYESDNHDNSMMGLYRARDRFYVGMWDSERVNLELIDCDTVESAIDFFRAYELEYMQELELI